MGENDSSWELRIHAAVELLLSGALVIYGRMLTVGVA